MKNVFFGAILLICLAGCKSSVSKNRNFKITSDKLVSADFVKNFPQKEIKIPNSLNLPEPQKPHDQVHYAKTLHISNISTEEMVIIKRIEDIK